MLSNLLPFLDPSIYSGLNPETTLIVDAERTYTLTTLHKQISSAIQNISEKKHTLAGLFFDHTTGCIVGMLIAYAEQIPSVPFHPDHPDNYIRSIIEENGISLVITDAANYARVSGLVTGLDIEIFLIDAEYGEKKRKDSVLNIVTDEDRVISLLFTSGTTGKRKGVIRTNANLTSITRQAQFHFIPGEVLIRPGEQVALTYSYLFYSGFRIIYTTLKYGGTLHLFDLSKSTYAEFEEWIQKKQITCLELPVSYFRSFMDSLDNGVIFPSVRTIVLAGQRVNPQDIIRYQSHFSQNSQLVILYGLTETGCICRSIYHKEDQIERKALSVGYPYNGQDVRIVDDNDQEAQKGEAGEIVISSPSVSPGYFGDEQYSSRYFITLRNHPEKVFFRTGDIGEYLPDGSLYLHGRKDRIVKIRGYRVNLGEIEQYLLSTGLLSQAAVVTRKTNNNEEERIIAYVAPIKDTTIHNDTIYQKLSVLVPDYLLPSDIIICSYLPMTSNGKVDYQNLLFNNTFNSASRKQISFRSELEKEIYDIWSEVLGNIPGSTDENFISLGGDSLKAVQVITLMQDRIDERISLFLFIKNLTIQSQADSIAKGIFPTSSFLVQLKKGRGIPIILIPDMKGDPFSFLQLSHKLEVPNPVYSCDLKLLSKKQDFRQIDFWDVPLLLRGEIRNTIQDEKYIIGGICNGGLYALDIAMQESSTGNDLPLTIIINPGKRPIHAPHWDFFPTYSLRRL
jgi:surfactin family lipopeptide synthetase A